MEMIEQRSSILLLQEGFLARGYVMMKPVVYDPDWIGEDLPDGSKLISIGPMPLFDNNFSFNKQKPTQLMGMLKYDPTRVKVKVVPVGDDPKKLKQVRTSMKRYWTLLDSAPDRVVGVKFLPTK